MARTYRKSQSQQQQQQNRVVRQRVREALNSVGKTSPAEVRAIVVSVVENLTRPRAPKELHSVRRTVICRAMDRDCKHSPKFNTDPEEPECTCTRCATASTAASCASTPTAREEDW